MAVNYNILRPEGPTNLYEGFAAGQQAAAQNKLTQQKMAQEQEMNALRRQEFQANLEFSQAERRRKAVAEKTAMFRDRVLRAPTPQAARELIRLQHSDPDLGPVIQQFGSLDQDLADIPDDPTGFENWRQREAMGAAEFIKSQASEQRFQALVARARGGQQGATVPSAAPAGELVAAPMPSPTGTVRNIAPAGASGAASRAVFNQDAIAGIDSEAQKSISLILDDAAQLRAKADEFRGSVRASGFLSQAEQLENQAASMLAVQKRRASESRFDTGAPATAEQINAARQALAVSQTPITNTLAPAAAPVTNAMLASAAQPAAARPAGGGRTPEQIRAEIDILSMDNDPRAARMVQTLQKEYAAALEAQGKTTTPKIDVIGVAEDTKTPVFFDARTDQLFTIGTDASGRQVRKPYTGGVNRATSSVTATATSTGGRLESAEQKGQGELNIKSFGEIRDAARLAAKTLPALDTQSKILDQGFTTGFGTDVKTAGASVLAALGVKNAEKFATNSQTFLAATQQAVLQKQLEQKGTQTAADAERITQTAAQRGNTVDANRFLIDVAREQLRRDIEQRDFYSNWWNNKKTYEGAEDAWYAGDGGKSLFDRPALKKYAAPAQGAAPAIPQAAINDLKAGRGTDAQFDAIFGAGAAKRVREGK